MAISTGNIALPVDALLEHFVTRVLGFQNFSMREWVNIVIEADTVIVFFGCFTGKSLLLWEVQRVAVLLFEVILGVTLCTD